MAVVLQRADAALNCVIGRFPQSAQSNGTAQMIAADIVVRCMRGDIDTALAFPERATCEELLWCMDDMAAELMEQQHSDHVTMRALCGLLPEHQHCMTDKLPL
eukprot:TRINITY_DN19728_c0_g1_i1.p2 TRINITY_DN19728_c0_g1~~TRINITY_DN19728_c0_g1_i1.p2  ORF type:complete len:103 (+),score=10.82 TRINITY_DN19728_c0_g1_i1:171-479(+)